MIAARRVQAPVASAQRPSPGLASTASRVELTVKEAAWAGEYPPHLSARIRRVAVRAAGTTRWIMASPAAAAALADRPSRTWLAIRPSAGQRTRLGASPTLTSGPQA